MYTLIDYIDNYKDRTFDESPFNDVDNIIFSAFAYIDLLDIFKEKMTMQEIGKIYFKKHNETYFKKYSTSVRKMINAFKQIYNSPRYKDIVLTNYVDLLDDIIQFSAICLTLPDNTLYVSFEGTDDSLTGWHEDFDLTHTFPVPSQKKAIEYLNKVIKFKHKKVLVGGHSKGGNLAMTSAMYTKWYNRHKIKIVYNNDGPGFREEEYEGKEFARIQKKLKMYVPENCIIGFLLRHPDKYTVVKSIGSGMYQHDPNNWLCYGDHLIPGKLTKESIEQEQRFKSFLDEFDDIERKKVVDTLFELFTKSGATVFSEVTNINLTRLIKLLSASTKLTKEQKKLLIGAFEVLLVSKVKE